MAARRRLTPEEQAALVADYKNWMETQEGTVEDIWARYNVSKQGGYLVLDRHGVERDKKVPAKHRPPDTVPMAIVNMMMEAFRAQIADLQAENKELRRRLDRKR